MIKIKNLTFAYEAGGQNALDIPELEIREGEYLALIGPNTSGKTTLLRHLNALLLPSSGEVKIDELDTRERSQHLEIRRRVGMIFQNPDNQIVGMSVEEDVAFGPCNLGLTPSQVRQRVDHALETVGLIGLETRSPHWLSGGQRQLLALAGLLAMEPRYIVLDEPTSALDPAAKDHVLTLLHRLKDAGLGIVHATHNMNEAALAQRLIVLHQGRIQADGWPAAILGQVGWLRSLNLAPPAVIELMWLLRQKGLDVDSRVVLPDEAAEEIMRLVMQPDTLGAEKKKGEDRRC